MRVGRCVLALACVNEHHSALFQNQSGTLSACSPSPGFTLNTRARTVGSSFGNALEYSPFGSRTMKRAFGVLERTSCASSRLQRISPATVHDLPLPVFPRTARWRPKSRFGSMQTSASPASGSCQS